MAEARKPMGRFPFPAHPNGWFRVAYADEISAGEVKPLVYFGRDLVLFRDEAGAAHVLAGVFAQNRPGRLEGRGLVARPQVLDRASPHEVAHVRPRELDQGLGRARRLEARDLVAAGRAGIVLFHSFTRPVFVRIIGAQYEKVEELRAPAWFFFRY